MVGPTTAPQKAALAALFTGLDWTREIQPVLVEAFGAAARRSLTAAQSQAILGLASSMGDDQFLGAWAGLANAS